MGRAALRAARERQFDALQQFVANLGPALGVVLIAGLAWYLVVTNRALGTAASEPRRPVSA
jgi:hypothetical protein